MSEYVRCSPRVIYEITRDNKVIYKGENRQDMKIILDALLCTKHGDVYVIEHVQRRYMLLDDEDLQKRIVTKRGLDND